MRTISLVFFGLSLLMMLGGMIYYIVIGSKGDLNPLKGFFFIGGFILAGMVLATIAVMLQ